MWWWNIALAMPEIVEYHRGIPPQPRRLRPLHRQVPERRTERLLIQRQNVRRKRTASFPAMNSRARTANRPPVPARTSRSTDTPPGRCVGIPVLRLRSRRVAALCTVPAPDAIRALRLPPHGPSSSGRRHATPAAGGRVDLLQISNGVAEVRAKREGIVRRPRGRPTAIVRLWFVSTFERGLPKRTCTSRLRS